MNPQIQIPHEDLKWIQATLRGILPNVRIFAFGSRTNGTSKTYSDLDLALKNPSPIEFKILSKVKENFSEGPLLYKVDIIDLDVVDESFKKIILANAIEI